MRCKSSLLTGNIENETLILEAQILVGDVREYAKALHSKACASSNLNEAMREVLMIARYVPTYEEAKEALLESEAELREEFQRLAVKHVRRAFELALAKSLAEVPAWGDNEEQNGEGRI